MTLHLFLQALDVWLFRDGRPFDAGSANRAESMFPPYPTVIQGAFRTHKLLQHGDINLGDKSEENKIRIADLVGEPDKFGNLRLRGPYLARRNGKTVTRYFPQPADAIADGQNLIPAKLSEPSSTLKTNTSSLQVFGLTQPSGKPKEPVWVDENSLKEYLAGKTVKGIKASDLFVREERIGIGMNDKRVVDEGLLYETEFIRPQDRVGLIVEMEDVSESAWSDGGILSLGGEGKQAFVEKVKVAPLPKPPVSASRFKMFFATPTYFNGGWIPSKKIIDGKEQSDWSRFFEGNVKLLGAAINRYETIGGFNWAGNPNDATAHRPARRFVPAGSVYYFEGSPQFVKDLPQHAITDFGAQIGFGQIIIKEW